MATFDFVDNDILIDGISSATVARTLQEAGIAKTKIGEILGFWYVGATGKTQPPPFGFETDVQTHDPNCEITYERTFTHVDWVDGEDRVQASATPEELGFNARFHAIENEFDAIADQFRRLGHCALELRADLVGVVREIESKLTALQNDIFDLRKDALPEKPLGSGLGILGAVKVGEKDAFITSFDNDFKLVEFAGSTLAETRRVDALEIGRGVVYDARTVRPGELVEIVAGLEDAMSVPAIRSLLERPDGATVAEVRAHAGGLTLPNGVTLASVMATMPADTTLTGVVGAVDTITAHLVSTLPTETLTTARDQVIIEPRLRTERLTSFRSATATGVGVDATTVETLAGAGVDTTIGALARTTTAELARAVAASGVEVRTGSLRTAVARARVASAIRGAER
jgi:hypothetical protein